MSNSLVKGTLYLSLSSFMFMVSGYLINVWLGKHLGPSQYGIYGIVISTLTLVNIMQTAGLPQALSRFVSGRYDSPQNIFGTAIKLQLVSTFILSFIFCIIAIPISNALKDHELVPYFFACSAILPFYGLFSIYMGYYNGLHKFKRQAFMNTVYSLSKLIFVILLTIKYRLYGAIAGFALSPITSLLFGARDKPLWRSTFSWIKLFKFSVPLIAFAVTSTMLLSIDLFILKSIIHSNEIAGYYVAAQNIARLPYYALNALALVLLPAISRLTNSNKTQEARTLINQSMRWMLILLIPSSFILAFTDKSIISLLFSPQYLPAFGALKILILAYAFLVVFTVFASILSGSGHPTLPFIISVAGLSITVAGCTILIPKYSLTGAAWGTVLGSAASAVISYAYIYKYFVVHFPYTTFIRTLVITLLISLPFKYLFLNSWQLILAYIIFSSLYIILLYVTKELNKQDKKIILGFLPSRLKFN
jgi:O-antigen/teichoic acid export membrane protein